MKPSGLRAVGVVLLALVTSPVAADDDGVFAPGVRHVCVPTADGEGWDCGTAEAPPAGAEEAARAAAEREAQAAAAAPTKAFPAEVESESAPDNAEEDLAPPPFLIAPGDHDYAPLAPIDDPDEETVEVADLAVEAAPEDVPVESPGVSVASDPVPAETLATAPQAESVSGAEPVVAAAASAAPERATDEPVQADAAPDISAPLPVDSVVEPAPETAPVVVADPSPDPSSQPTVTETPEADAAEIPAPAAPAPELAEAPSEVATPATPQADHGRLAGQREFAGLAATAFTLQLAYADSPNGFADLVARLGLDPATCYSIRVKLGGGSWLLAHGQYADVASARAAQAALPAVAGLSAQWPRRIGALQAEAIQEP